LGYLSISFEAISTSNYKFRRPIVLIYHEKRTIVKHGSAHLRARLRRAGYQGRGTDCFLKRAGIKPPQAGMPIGYDREKQVSERFY